MIIKGLIDKNNNKLEYEDINIFQESNTNEQILNDSKIDINNNSSNINKNYNNISKNPIIPETNNYNKIEKNNEPYSKPNTHKQKNIKKKSENIIETINESSNKKIKKWK